MKYSFVPAKPTTNQMLHFGPDLNYTCAAPKALYGVQVLEFTKNFTHPVDGNYTITYYWQGNEPQSLSLLELLLLLRTY